MVSTIDFNVSPYFDDFDPDKKFLRHLFRPGFAVQARELTQIQSILQNQIERFGSHIFEDGSKVLGADIADQNIKFLRVEPDFDLGPGAVSLDLTDFIGFEIVSDTDANLKATVFHAIEVTGDDPYVIFFIEYTSTGAGGTNEFQSTDVVFSTKDTPATALRATVKDVAVDSDIAITGDAIMASIDDGIFFIDGFFALTDAQRVVPFRPAVAADAPVPLNARLFTGINARIGFDISKDIVTSNDDSSLLDPAFGSPNANAPGADRFRIQLLIDFKLFEFSANTPADFSDQDFVEWMRVQQDIVVLQAVRPDYSALENELAERVEAIHGSFTVRPFGADIRPHLKNDLYTFTVTGQIGTFQVGENVTGGTSGAVGVVNFITDFDISFLMTSGEFVNSETLTGGTSLATATTPASPAISTFLTEDTKGVFTLAQGGEEDSVAFGLEPGKAFVRGFEFSNLETEFVKIDKARDTDSVTGFNVTTSFGNYVLVDATGDTFTAWDAAFDIDTAPIVTLRDSGNVAVGTARIRQLVRDSSDSYRVYIFDSTFDAGKTIADVREIFFSPVVFWNIHTPEGVDPSVRNRKNEAGTILFESNNNKAWFSLPVGDSTEQFTGTDWRTQQQFSVALNALGVGSTATTSPRLRFIGPNPPTPVSGAELGFYTVIIPATGEIIDMSAVGNSIVTNNNLPASNGQITVTITNSPTPVAGTSVVLIATLEVNDQSAPAPSIRRNKVLQKDFAVPGTITLEATQLILKGGDAGTVTGALDDNFDFSGPEIINLPVGTATLDSNGKIVATLEWIYTVAANFLGPFTLGETMTGQSSTSTAKINCDSITVDATSTLAAGNPGDPQIFLPGEYVFEGATLASATAIARVLTPTTFRFIFGMFANNVIITGASSGATRTFVIEDTFGAFSIYRASIFDMDASTTGVFENAEDILAGSSGSTITVNQIFDYVADAIITLDAGADVFNAGDIIVGGTSGASAEVISVTLRGTIELADIFGVTLLEDQGNVDVESAFFVDDGQRDNLYDHGFIEYDPQSGASVIMPLTVRVNYFEHQGDGPLYVNSYTHTSPGSNLRFEHIPLYTSPQTGETVALRDVIDFRPIRAAGSQTIEKLFFAQAGQAFDANYSFHLPRIDKIVLRKEQRFDVIRGIPSLEAEIPPDDPESLTLYVVKLSPFTYDVANIQARFVENKRFSMSDIGDIERRVQRLEYYTSLTLLERETEALSVPDATGEDRFKNGILVDSFQGHSIGDVLNPDYDVAIDFQDRELRPPFISRPVAIEKLGGTLSNLAVSSDGIVTLEFTETPLIFQPLASTAVSINPFNVVNWMGTMSLTPSSDTWVDVEQRPELRVNLEGENDAWDAIVSAANGAMPNGFGTQWGDWEVAWAGRTTTTRTFRRTSRRSVSAPHASRAPDGVMRRRVEDTVSTVERTVEVLRGRETRLGIQTRVVPERIERSLGNRVVDVSIIPFIRPRDGSGGNAAPLGINAEGMKPNTQVFPFFDCVEVSEFCRPSGGALGDAIITDSAGKVLDLEFELPAGRFRTGDRLFRLTDEPSNIVANAVTTSERMWNAQGLLQSREEAIISTRVPVLRRQTVTQQRPARDVRTRDRTVRSQTRVRWVDPLAQTFLIDSNLHPNGVFLTSLDLFLRGRPDPSLSGVPITVQIRPVVNGFPHSSAVVPFSETSLEPSAVNVSDNPDPSDSNTKTTFNFSSPVFLEGGQEYAVVLLSNSNEYFTYIATIGQDQLGTEDRISMQPYAGSLFRSQNASTWTPDQTSDLMFSLNRAVFTSNVGSVDYKNVENVTVVPATFPSIAGVNELYLLTSQLEFPDSTLDLSVDIPFEGTAGLLPGQFQPILANQRERFATRREIFVTTSPHTFLLRVRMTSADDAISPVLDEDRLQPIAIENRVNDARNTNFGEPTYNGELEPRASAPSNNVPIARYISRLVTLQPGFESTDMRVFLTVNKRIETEVHVFIKAQTPEAEGDFPNERYVQLQPTANVISENDDDFREMEFGLPEEFAEPYSKFTIKVTLYTSNTSVVPRVKDLRAIAVI